MAKYFLRVRYLRVWAASGSLLAFGGCGLTDQQLTGILTSVITSGLGTLVNTFLSALVPATG